MSLVMSRSHALVTRLRGATSLVHDRSIARCTPTDRVSKNARLGDLRRWQSTTKSVDERLPRVIAQTTVFENPWLRLKAIRFLDERGAERQWTGLERTTTYPDGHAIGQESKCDAVVVFPFLTQPDAPTRVILIRQFRPPVGKWVVELPAGLIDGEEAPDVAASRELQEETGYVASRVLHMGPPMVNDQGITNGSCRFVLMQVEADAQASAEPTQQLEADEMIQVLVAPLESLVPWLLERQHTHGDAIDARLYSYALGLQGLPPTLA
ncbi:hypothetical protein Poli38472_007472 [Pythium oligandrum]|uniref:Nudix hydrolase domain-containing protein n=1 Tax=Pythium oligandrum TaxID=41045 RepID=A0A8K1FL36_PYTOL|nr:hypothetical protein Poli38472_007472 [Pythium oligandrum]|eukprot:TMW67800.1 hypothetical protein Poli38472_007472 [Pythium oligandrum]